MCLQIYLGASRTLPLLKWNNADPKFHVKNVVGDEQADFIRQLLATDAIYTIGSFMGCACGLNYGSDLKQAEPENYNQRVQDVRLLKKYLRELLPGNFLKIFATW